MRGNTSPKPVKDAKEKSTFLLIREITGAHASRTICCFTNACGKSTILFKSLFHFAPIRLKAVPGIQSGTCCTGYVAVRTNM